METCLSNEVEFKLRGMLSIPPQFVCDVVCFNRFSDDLMRAAYNPLDPPIVNTKISIRLVGFPCGRNRVEGTSEKRKKLDIFHLCVSWGGGLRQAERLIGDSVGEKEGNAKKKKKKSTALGMSVCGRETMHCWTAGKKKVSQEDGRSIPPLSLTTNTLSFFFLSA